MSKADLQTNSSTQPDLTSEKHTEIGLSSILNELSPETIEMLSAHFPDYFKALQSGNNDIKSILEKAIASDDKSTENVYDILKKELERNDNIRQEEFDSANKVLDAYNKMLDNPNLTSDERQKIRSEMLELLQMIHQNNTEARNQSANFATMAYDKDSETKGFDWKSLAVGCLAIVAATWVGAAVLGGKIDLKLPKIL